MVSASRFPLLTVEFHGVCSDSQFRTYLNAMDGHIDRSLKNGQRSVVLLDTLRATTAVSAAQRKMQNEWMTKNYARQQEAWAGYVLVIDNAVIRGVLTAALWFGDMPCEYAVVASRGEAESWAAARLSAPSLPQR